MKDEWVAVGVLLFVAGVIIGLFLSARLPSSTYTNLESWDIVKDENGRVTGVRVHRNARKG